MKEESSAQAMVLALVDLDKLMAALAATHDVLGPKVADGALAYGPVSRLADLPRGMDAEQSPGHFRLSASGREAYFDFTFGAQTWKSLFSPPSSELFNVRKGKDGYAIGYPPAPARPLALFGVRPCEMAAIAIQDRIYLQGEHVDQTYRARREGAVIIAVNCARPSGACFCVSMKTGPKVEKGYDVALTEVMDGADHYFLAQAGSPAGFKLLAGRGLAADAGQIRAATAVSAGAEAAMEKTLNRVGLKEALAASYDHPRWAKAGARCLACGSCAAVCPTCFCLKFEETTDLSGAATRKRGWDVCLSQEFSYIHGGPARPSAAARYRHFVIHKLSGWVDQFGAPGCVGCGRCAVWCPAGIDIVEEASAVAGASGGES